MEKSVKVCQSCGMPMEDLAQYATEADGAKNDTYCVYCYHDGAFTQEGTLEEMIETCVPFLMESGMAEADVRTHLRETLPRLKRWQGSGND